MIFITMILTTFADTIWGGQNKFIQRAKRPVALGIFMVGFTLLFSWQVAAAVIAGYLARRIHGWRLPFGDEHNILPMKTKMDGAYMAMFSLGLGVTPVMLSVLVDIPLTVNALVVTGVASVLIGAAYYITISGGFKVQKDRVWLAEILSGLIMGAAFYIYITG